MPRKDGEPAKQWTVEVASFRAGGSYPYFKSVILFMSTFTVCAVLLILTFLNWPWVLMIGAVMGGITVIFGVSPALTEHQIGGKALILNHGWYFHAKVPLENIRDVEETEEGIPGHGVNFLLGGNRLYLANSRVGLVKVKLHDRQKMGGVFGRFITEVVLSVDEPGAFVRSLKERAGLRSRPVAKNKCPSCGQELIKPARSDAGVIQGQGADRSKPSVPMIECIFLVHNDGRLITSYKSGRVQTKEAFSVMGMFTAIQDFVKDAFKRTDGDLRTLEHGDLKVLLERGKNIYLAVVIEGGEEPHELRTAMRRALKEVEAKAGHILNDDWNGELTELGDLKKILAQVLWT